MSTPIFKKLIQPLEFEKLKQEAENNNTSGERLKELAAFSYRLARLVASNPATPPELLQKLAKRKDVIIRQNASVNPNNPSKKFSLLEYERLKPEAENENTSGERLKQIAAANIDLARLVASNPATPPELLERLAKHKDNIIRQHVSTNPSTPIKVLLNFEQGKKYPSLEKEAKNEKTAGERLKQIAALSVDLAELVASNPSAPPDLLQQLAECRKYTIRKNVAANPNTPVKILLKLDYGRLEQEAKDEKTSQERLQEIAALNIYLLAELVASNPATPPELLPQLAKQSVNIAILLAANPLTSPELLQQLAKRRSYSIRRTLTANPNTPTKVLLKLGEYFPEELLHNPMWSLMFLENPNILNEIPKATLISLLFYEINNDKHLIPAYCLQKLATHQNDRIRYYVAQHPKASVEILEKLALDVENLVRGRVALHPATPVYLLEKLAADNEHDVRHNVAKNPNTPVKVLKYLIQDRQTSISSAARRNLYNQQTSQDR